MNEGAGCVLVIFTRDESAEDLRMSFEMAHDLAVLQGAEELRVVRVVEIPPGIPMADDAGFGPLAERVLDRVLDRIRVPTVVLHRESA